MLVDLSHVSTAVMKQALEVTQIHTLNSRFLSFHDTKYHEI